MAHLERLLLRFLVLHLAAVAICGSSWLLFSGSLSVLNLGNHIYPP